MKMHNRLVKIGAICGTLKETVESTVCGTSNLKCIYGACNLHRGCAREIFDAEGEIVVSSSDKTFWHQWNSIRETLADGKHIRKTQKLRIEGSVEELKASFLKFLSDLKPHEFRVCHQFKILHG